jgi:hypothetical protein
MEFSLHNLLSLVHLGTVIAIVVVQKYFLPAWHTPEASLLALRHGLLWLVGFAGPPTSKHNNNNSSSNIHDKNPAFWMLLVTCIIIDCVHSAVAPSL